ncbi:MAG: site-2 protease family protein [Verrucomicrobiota bacterium]
MVRFSLFGIPIEIQPWFWITLALIGGAHRANSSEGLMVLALFIIAGALSILVHELGHALTIRHFGAPTRIVLQAFGGYAAYPAGILTRKQSFFVTAAGPALQMVWGALFLLVLIFGNLPETRIQIFVFYSMAISFFWAILNLIPVIPLDGGRLLESILGPKRIRLTLIISMVTAVIGAVILGYRFGSFLFPIFLGFMAYQNWQALQAYRR